MYLNTGLGEWDTHGQMDDNRTGMLFIAQHSCSSHLSFPKLNSARNKENAGQMLGQLLKVRVTEMCNHEPFLIHFIKEAKSSNTMT